MPPPAYVLKFKWPAGRGVARKVLGDMKPSRLSEKVAKAKHIGT